MSLEKIINDSRETYYDALGASSPRWHDARHSTKPWMGYFLGVLLNAYNSFEERVGAIGRRGSKSEPVRHFLRNLRQDEFTFDDIRRAAPGVSDAQIRRVLNELKASSSSRWSRASAVTSRRVICWAGRCYRRTRWR